MQIEGFKIEHQDYSKPSFDPKSILTLFLAILSAPFLLIGVAFFGTIDWLINRFSSQKEADEWMELENIGKIKLKLKEVSSKNAPEFSTYISQKLPLNFIETEPELELIHGQYFTDFCETKIGYFFISPSAKTEAFHLMHLNTQTQFVRKLITLDGWDWYFQIDEHQELEPFVILKNDELKEVIKLSMS